MLRLFLWRVIWVDVDVNIGNEEAVDKPWSVLSMSSAFVRRVDISCCRHTANGWRAVAELCSYADLGYTYQVESILLGAAHSIR